MPPISVRPLHLVPTALAGLLLLGGCTPEQPPPPPNVVVILVDTLRAQSLGVYGHDRPTSPTMDLLAAESTFFTDARAQAPCTYPSSNSILTGRHPVRFLGQKEGRMGIPSDIPSLAEILGAQGFATIAVSASPIVRRNPTRFNPHGGFDRGFDIFEERCLWKEAACVNQRALDYLRVLREPFFLYLHYMDPHDPLQLPDDWTPRIATEEYKGDKWFVEQGLLTPIADALYGPDKQVIVDDRDLAHLLDLYEEEIAYFDHQLGRLLEGLAELGLAENTLVALVADHGEEFLEHDHVKHCHSLYDTEIKTPMILRTPAQATGRDPAVTIDRPVANLSLAPTVLDYVGLDPAAYAMEAGSLRPLVESAGDGDLGTEIVVSTWGTERAATLGRFKLILDIETDTMELYDLESDPGETVDVQAEHPEAVRQLRGAIRSWVRTAGKDAARQIQEGQEAQERLKALGYLQ